MSLVWYMAFAANYGFNFGGVVTYKDHCPTSHGVDTLAAMSSLLGQDAGTLFLSEPPPMDFKFRARQLMLDSAPWLRNCSDANVAVRTERFNPMGQDVASGWAIPPPTTRDFISALRQGAQFLGRAVRYRPGELSVALHVRRDDIDAREARRYTPDGWYYKLVERMGEAYAVKMDVHVFSSTGSRYNASDFDGFRARGMALHLDEDVLDDWAHMARADVLVMARSSFSLIPALLRRQCVLDTTHWTMGAGWKKELHFVRVNASMKYLDSPQFASDLMACKQSVARLDNSTLK